MVVGKKVRRIVLAAFGVALLVMAFLAARWILTTQATISSLKGIQIAGGTVAWSDQWQYGQSGIGKEVNLLAMRYVDFIFGSRTLANVTYVEIELGSSVNIANLSPCTGLQALFYGGKNLSSEEVAAIGSFRRMKMLSLTATNFSDADLATISSLTELTTLGLANSQVTDEGLKHLGTFSQLSELHLGGTTISDHGLASLRSLHRLVDLYLDHTSITDKGLAELAHLPALKYVDLNGTRVTEVGVNAFRKARPEVFLYWESYSEVE